MACASGRPIKTRLGIDANKRGHSRCSNGLFLSYLCAAILYARINPGNLRCAVPSIRARNFHSARARFSLFAPAAPVEPVRFVAPAQAFPTAMQIRRDGSVSLRAFPRVARVRRKLLIDPLGQTHLPHTLDIARAWPISQAVQRVQNGLIRTQFRDRQAFYCRILD